MCSNLMSSSVLIVASTKLNFRLFLRGDRMLKPLNPAYLQPLLFSFASFANEVQFCQFLKHAQQLTPDKFSVNPLVFKGGI